MARIVRDTSLGSREARSKLAPGRRYYRGIEAGLHLGYRRAKAHGRKLGGHWFARVYRGRGSEQYIHTAIGAADDILDADGVQIFNFDQAQKRAREIFKAHHSPAPSGGPLTVKQAGERYVEFVKAERKTGHDTELRLKRHVYPKLGDKAVAALTMRDIEKWKHGLVQTDDKDPDAERRSKDTANRVLSMLKAALNRAFADDANAIPSDAAWRRIRPFKDVGRSRQVHLDAAQSLRLINACGDEAFRRLVTAALLTGARAPGELIGLRVRDFRADLRTLSIPDGKTGPRTVTLTTEAVRFFEDITAGKKPDDLLLPKEDGSGWGPNAHVRLMQEAAKRAKLPKDCTIYSLRHTHASQALLNKMNMQFLAENMGTSVRMIEQHYGKFLAQSRHQLVEESSLRLGLEFGDKVKKMMRR